MRPASAARPTMSETFAVNEVFESIQGEARHAGTPSVFVRLQGCAVGCPWCDTKHTWAADPDQEVSPEAMLAKEGGCPDLRPLDAGRHPVCRGSVQRASRGDQIHDGQTSGL